MSLIKLSLAGNNLINDSRPGRFGYWHPGGDGKIANLFLQCIFPEHYKILSKVVLSRRYNTNTLYPFEMLQIYDVSGQKTARVSLEALRGERGRYVIDSEGLPQRQDSKRAN